MFGVSVPHFGKRKETESYPGQALGRSTQEPAVTAEDLRAQRS